MQGNEELLRGVVRAGLDEIPQLMGALRSAIAGNDAAALHQAAHTLKTSLRYIGAHGAADQALQLELVGREGRIAEGSSLMSRFAVEIEHVIADLRDFLTR